MSMTTEATKTRAAAKAAKAALEARTTITPEDAHNTIILLNRVQTTGMQEAALLVTLGQKFHTIKGSYEVTKQDG